MAASMSSSVEDDDRRHPLVGVDLDDCEQLDAERVGPLIASRKSVLSEGEALCARRNDRRFHIPGFRSAVCVHAEFGISTLQVPHFTTRRRSSMAKPSDNISASASQSWAAKHA